jgi:citrate lyase subunit beta/citryl-CoA lyase
MSDPFITPRRSVLYVPGGSARMHDKSRNVPADALVFDLEDSVAPEAKSAARELVAETVKKGEFGGREIAIRVNPASTEWFLPDIENAGKSGPDAILLTKVNSPDEIRTAESRLDGWNVSQDVKLWAMIETPRGILNCSAIADMAVDGRSRRLAGLVIGTNDIAKETGMRAGAARAPLVPLLALSVTAARAAGLFVLDGVFNNFSDTSGYEAECEQGRDLGFDGKTLIHPDQIDIANRVFSPSQDEIDEARRMIAAFELPENKGRGAIRFEGRMVEILHADIARRTLSLAARLSSSNRATSR